MTGIEIEDLGQGLKRGQITHAGLSFSILNFGARSERLRWRDRDLLLGYPNPQDYLTDPFFIGAIIGRMAGRIPNAELNWAGRSARLHTNEGPNTLHGGAEGLSQQFWDMEARENQLILRYHSPEGEGGFWGALDLILEITLGEDQLHYRISATGDQDMPLSLTQHNYYHGNLQSGDLALDIGSEAKRFVLDEALLATGALSQAKPDLSDMRSGIDDIFLPRAGQAIRVENRAHPNPYAISFTSNQPVVVIYDGGSLSAPFSKNAGFCIEPQAYPNALNIPAFPDPILKAGTTQNYELTLKFSELT